MRNINTYTAIILLISVLYACERDDNNNPKQESSVFVFTTEKDSESWVATKTWSYFFTTNNSFTLSGAMEDSVYFQEEVINLSVDKNKIRIGQKLRDFDARWSFVIGGDQIAGLYEKTENDEESYIIINKIDTVNSRIAGIFNIRLKDARSTDDYYINFKNGSFDLRFEDIVPY